MLPDEISMELIRVGGRIIEKLKGRATIKIAMVKDHLFLNKKINWQYGTKTWALLVREESLGILAIKNICYRC